ncbi:MAG: HAMP domain-containing sensor histidine kinase, partial [Betaproteobacteria bacterium]
MGDGIRRDPHVDGATDPQNQLVAVALHDLAFLNEQVAAARMELATLRSDLAQLRHEVRGTRSGQLLEANQNLVLAALTAQEVGANTDEAHRRQIQFLATVAHELRNPLTPIRTAAELITRARTDESLLPRLQLIIKRQVAHMSRLVDDLLDGSRISTGKFRLERAIVKLSDVLDVSIEACRPAIDVRFQHFNVQLAPAALYVNGDPARLAQVFN